MIGFFKKENNVILSYNSEFAQSEDWVEKKFAFDRLIKLKKTFSFWQKDAVLMPKVGDEGYDVFDEYETKYFHFATLFDDYYKITKGILTDDFDIYVHSTIEFDVSFFVADSNISIWAIVSKLFKNDIYIGGSKPNRLPEKEFRKLIANFPNTYERKLYTEARVSSVLKNYFETSVDSELKYQSYRNKKISNKGKDLSKIFQESELIKYSTILEKLEEMLVSENLYSEKQWQSEILEIILLLYPKYIQVFKEVSIKDKNFGNKFLDFLLIDSNGHVDIIEIKRPFDNSIVTEQKYRGNFIPLRELSGTIMQLEKYIFYLNQSGNEGERALNSKFKSQLPRGFEIRIVNPSGIIIMGRENNLSVAQRKDFEVIKRKYKNVLDIITYDSLIQRLKFTISQIKLNIS